MGFLLVHQGATGTDGKLVVGLFGCLSVCLFVCLFVCRVVFDWGLLLRVAK